LYSLTVCFTVSISVYGHENRTVESINIEEFTKNSDFTLNELSLQLEDTLIVDYNKIRKNGKKARWRKGKVFVQGDILSLFREELERADVSIDSIIRYPPTFQPHKIELDYYLDNFVSEHYQSEVQWAEVQKISVAPFAEHKFKEINSSRTVYGFHPYWMGNSYYNYEFNLYNRIGYYGYVIDPKTGGDYSTASNMIAHSWATSTLHEKAASFGCKVDLCVVSYQPENNAVIFAKSGKGPKVREALVANILSLVKEKGNGVCFDIQKVPSSLKGNYIQLIKDISTGLNGDVEVSDDSERAYQITVVLPRYDIGFPFNMTQEDVNELVPFVDRWIMSGDSYYGAEITENAIGPTWNFEEIDYQINRYPPDVFDRLLLEIPMYESHAIVNDSGTVVYTKQFREIIQLNPELAETLEGSFREKLQYANLKELNGIAIWGMGYDLNTRIINALSSYAELEDLNVDAELLAMLEGIIADNEAASDSLDLPFEEGHPNPDLQEIELQKSSTIGFWDRIIPEKIEVHHVVVFCLVILLFFAIIAVIIALFFEAARELLLSKEYIINLAVLVVILSLIIVLKRLEIIDDTGLVFAGGIGAGVFATWIFSRKRAKKESEETP
jgi:hypothetical protein